MSKQTYEVAAELAAAALQSGKLPCDPKSVANYYGALCQRIYPILNMSSEKLLAASFEE